MTALAQAGNLTCSTTHRLLKLYKLQLHQRCHGSGSWRRKRWAVNNNWNVCTSRRCPSLKCSSWKWAGRMHSVSHSSWNTTLHSLLLATWGQRLEVGMITWLGHLWYSHDLRKEGKVKTYFPCCRPHSLSDLPPKNFRSDFSLVWILLSNLSRTSAKASDVIFPFPWWTRRSMRQDEMNIRIQIIALLCLRQHAPQVLEETLSYSTKHRRHLPVSHSI